MPSSLQDPDILKGVGEIIAPPRLTASIPKNRSFIEGAGLESAIDDLRQLYRTLFLESCGIKGLQSLTFAVDVDFDGYLSVVPEGREDGASFIRLFDRHEDKIQTILQHLLSAFLKSPRLKEFSTKFRTQSLAQIHQSFVTMDRFSVVVQKHRLELANEQKNCKWLYFAKRFKGVI